MDWTLGDWVLRRGGGGTRRPSRLLSGRQSKGGVGLEGARITRRPTRESRGNEAAARERAGDGAFVLGAPVGGLTGPISL